ncbi:hypothetical protein ENSA5_00630 [Enhygromyxa salina]|uniref:BNR repeat domain protein n=1 Tax=Enhygromyxa salina TaxID=215803 RepID=A0A2S9YKW9_9BACT|nr:hypothetical protein [Enhygromyxa salina]PRQ05743.1 hypothetical protein ENSA5_00630 [Enhygromyxa salina]
MSARSRPQSLACLALAVLLGGCEPEPAPEPAWEIGFEADESFGALLSAWGPSPTELYAVGGNPERGAMIRFDGDAWSEQALPEGFPLANWVFGLPAEGGTTLWVAGNEGMAARRDVDGSWTTMDLGTTGPLWGIWGTADSNMWAVGGSIPGDEPILAHYDGSAWTMVPIPALDRELDALFKVWGTSSTQVFAVGHSGVILHYDGSEWTQQLAGTASDLISLWGTGPNEIVAVGGRSNGVIARYDGQAWRSETIGMLPGLNGVWLDSEGTGFAVGVEGLVIEIPAGTFDYEELDRSARPDVLHGAFGFDEGARVGVGGNLLFSPPWTGVIVQYLP